MLVVVAVLGLVAYGITRLDELRPKYRMVAVAAGSLGLLLLAVGLLIA